MATAQYAMVASSRPLAMACTCLSNGECFNSYSLSKIQYLQQLDRSSTRRFGGLAFSFWTLRRLLDCQHFSPGAGDYLSPKITSIGSALHIVVMTISW